MKEIELVPHLRIGPVQDNTRLQCPKHLFISSRVIYVSLLSSAFTLSKVGYNTSSFLLFFLLSVSSLTVLLLPSVAYFQSGSPIYSSHYVRFRLGHLDNKSQEKNNYVWTYTSQQFAMAQVCVCVCVFSICYQV